MIDQLITSLSVNSPCKFELVEQEFDHFSFYRATSLDYQRFLVVVHTEKLIKPSDLNQQVLANSPDELRELPAFAKNTDVIVLFKLDNIADIVNFESEIFSLEEDVYSFKKHVLYYSQAELDLLHDIDANSIGDLLKDQSKFNVYKQSSLIESEYGIASRIFIKLPFLSVPIDESELDDPCVLADTALEEAGSLELCQRFEIMLADSNSDFEAVITEYIHEKMANPQA